MQVVVCLDGPLLNLPILKIVASVLFMCVWLNLSILEIVASVC